MNSPLAFTDAARTACVVASGPSAVHSLEQIPANAPVIAVSDAWRLLPNAAALYCAGTNWWDYHGTAVRDNYRGSCWVPIAKCAQQHGLNYVPGIWKSGLSTTPNAIHLGAVAGGGRNSALQAMGLAYLWGARRIVLAGVDLCDPAGQVHFFGDHPPELARTRSYAAFQREIELLVADLARTGVAVLNLSPHSRIAGTESIATKNSRSFPVTATT